MSKHSGKTLDGFDDHDGELAQLLLDQIAALDGKITQLTARIEQAVAAIPVGCSVWPRYLVRSALTAGGKPCPLAAGMSLSHAAVAKPTPSSHAR